MGYTDTQWSTEDNKSDVKRRNTIGCQYMKLISGKILTQHLQRFGTVKNQDREAAYVDKYGQRMNTVKQSGPWTGLRECRCYVFTLRSVYLVYKCRPYEIWIY